jgi:hypothetical protein
MSRGRTIYYYGTKSDCAPIFEVLNSQMDLKYVVDEDRVDSNFDVFPSPLDFAGFGKTRWKNNITQRFLILPVDADAPYEYRPQRQVPEKYGFFTPQSNYCHVYFDSSCFCEENNDVVGLLEGWVSTNSSNPQSLAIFESIKKIMKKKWARVKGSYLGPEALAYLRSGGRLSQDLTRPVLYDLQEDAPAS